MMPPNTASLGEAIDSRRCPRCGGERTRNDGFLPDPPSLGFVALCFCLDCAETYRVTFRAVRVEAE